MIVAFCKNRGIGYKNNIPWHIPKELKYFKRKTTKGDNNIVVMGRNTWDSLPIKPLPKRKNIIISSSLSKDEIQLSYKNTIVQSDFDELNDTLNILLNKKEKIWLIGGKSIYDYYIHHPKLDKIYTTQINNIFLNDVKFPEIPNYFYIKASSNLFHYNNISYSHQIWKNKWMR